MSFLLMGLVVFSATQAEGAAAPSPAAVVAPLTLGEGGAVLRDGKPCRAIGVNYFDLFSRLLANPDPASIEKGLDELSRRGIPFARFMACPFWPSEWKLYREDKKEYFRRMDLAVRAAEKRGIGLIPSLFWLDVCVPDMMDEPRSAWGDPASRTIGFMRAYVAEVVGRYASSPAIWAWELGNEHSLAADLPNGADNRPPVVPQLGTRAARGPADDMTHDMIAAACREFGAAVRRADPHRLITSGHSMPRGSAEHQRAELSWTQDSRDEFMRNLADVTPDPLNLISVHLYPFDKERRFDQPVTPHLELLQLCMRASAASGKALFVGEFGAPDTEKDGGPEKARAEITEMIAAIEAAGVPLAALWVFDFPYQEDFVNVSTTNHRAWVLDELEKANRRLRDSAK